MLLITDEQLEKVSGAGGLGEALSGIGHVVDGATRVANAVNGGGAWRWFRDSMGTCRGE
ncbi:Uncharacterised protein [Salmonella enterica subsp. houtenae]|nr:Uncharacterised protein [Salmonella enterica subsp. houtenae]